MATFEQALTHMKKGKISKINDIFYRITVSIECLGIPNDLENPYIFDFTKIKNVYFECLEFEGERWKLLTSKDMFCAEELISNDWILLTNKDN